MKDRKTPDSPEKELPPEKDQPMETRSNTMKKGKQAALGRDIQAKIGQQLRSYYDTLIEPTPDRFAELLNKLDKPEGKEGGS